MAYDPRGHGAVLSLRTSGGLPGRDFYAPSGPNTPGAGVETLADKAPAAGAGGFNYINKPDNLIGIGGYNPMTGPGGDIDPAGPSGPLPSNPWDPQPGIPRPVAGPSLPDFSNPDFLPPIPGNELGTPPQPGGPSIPTFPTTGLLPWPGGLAGQPRPRPAAPPAPAPMSYAPTPAAAPEAQASGSRENNRYRSIGSGGYYGGTTS